MKTYTFYETGSHGYLKVKRHELRRLGIYNNISEYSCEFQYLQPDNDYGRDTGEYITIVLLEQDCDLQLFIKAKKEVNEEFEMQTISRSADWIERKGYFLEDLKNH